MIRLNGLVYLDGDEYFFEDFEVEGFEDAEKAERDLPFDFLIDDEDDYCDGNCELCDCCDDEEDNEETDFDEIVDELTSIYAEILDDVCECFDCRKSALTDLIKDFVDAL